MAMEDAIELARALVGNPADLPAALIAYEAAAQPSVRKIQDAARPSLAWWEHFGRYHDAFEPWQFAYHFLSRSITDARLSRRDPEFVAASHRGWADAHGAKPLQTPFERGGWRAPGRLLAISTDTDTTLAAVSGGSVALPLSVDPQPGPWGALVVAPDREADLPEVHARLAELARLGAAPVLVAVHGGTALTRVLACEQARMHEGLPALLIDPAADSDSALTMVLSGRADLVGVPA
jgi:anthraniloyl-CoA monooxygenase